MNIYIVDTNNVVTLAGLPSSTVEDYNLVKDFVLAYDSNAVATICNSSEEALQLASDFRNGNITISEVQYPDAGGFSLTAITL